ncbi:MAG: high frequency lysogenization protein HflD [Mariprofundaceae bacterium]
MNPIELSSQQNRALALAAMVQASIAAQKVSQTGSLRNELVSSCVSSLFSMDSKQNVSVRYGGVYHLRHGIKPLTRLLRGDEKFENGKETMMHTAAMMALERRLSKDQDMLQHLAASMERIGKQKNYFDDPCHENIIANLSSLYAETLSKLSPRIMVHGKQEFLRQSSHTDVIRAVLLSGVRAAYLWRIHGGNHLRLLLGRKKLIKDAEFLLHE